MSALFVWRADFVKNIYCTILSNSYELTLYPDSIEYMVNDDDAVNMLVINGVKLNKLSEGIERYGIK